MNFYIPGLGSGAESSTLKKYQKHIDISILKYNALDPIESLTTMADYLMDKCPSSDHINIFASSLGGWYAEKLAGLIPCSLFLYNPSTNPANSLLKYGIDPTITAEYDKLEELAPTNRTVCVCTDDTTVHPELALNLYKDYNLIISSGGHRMTDTNINKLITAYHYEQTQL
jgi:predicted esterase YcpF (UPF0227 family)